jgi:hypothetical protein
MSEQLSNKIKITKVAAGAASAGTEVDGTAVDMQGYEGVMFFTTIATANAGNYMKAQSGTDSTPSDAADLEGTKVVAAANTEVVWLDIYKPQERYDRPVIIRAGANTATGDIYAVQYGGRVGLEDNLTTNVIIGELHISPDEGTC